MTLIYCVKCRQKTDTNNETRTTMKNGKPALRGTCSVCGTQKTQFLPSSGKSGGNNGANSGANSGANKKKKGAGCYKEGGGFVNNFINNLPVEMHLPGYNFCGPGTKLNKRLNDDLTPKPWSKPINRVDEACYKHDIGYMKHTDTATRNMLDAEMLAHLKGIYNPTIGERLSRGFIYPIIGLKKRFGMGLDDKKKSLVKV